MICSRTIKSGMTCASGQLSRLLLRDPVLVYAEIASAGQQLYMSEVVEAQNVSIGNGGGEGRVREGPPSTQ